MGSTTSRLQLVAPQRWKLWLWGSGLAIAGLGLFFSAQVGTALGIDPTLLQIGGTLAGLFVLVGASLSIRCPSCRLSLVWHAVSKHPHDHWLSWLLDVNVCPRCGFKHEQHHGM
jgi:hypothetical protein